MYEIGKFGVANSLSLLQMIPIYVNHSIASYGLNETRLKFSAHQTDGWIDRPQAYALYFKNFANRIRLYDNDAIQNFNHWMHSEHTSHI